MGLAKVENYRFNPGISSDRCGKKKGWPGKQEKCRLYVEKETQYRQQRENELITDLHLNLNTGNQRNNHPWGTPKGNGREVVRGPSSSNPGHWKTGTSKKRGCFCGTGQKKKGFPQEGREKWSG